MWFWCWHCLTDSLNFGGVIFYSLMISTTRNLEASIFWNFRHLQKYPHFQRIKTAWYSVIKTRVVIYFTLGKVHVFTPFTPLVDSRHLLLSSDTDCSLCVVPTAHPPYRFELPALEHTNKTKNIHFKPWQCKQPPNIYPFIKHEHTSKTWVTSL